MHSKKFRWFLILAFAGAVVAFEGVRTMVNNSRLNAGASGTPEEISLQELLARGPDANPNVVVKDFRFCRNYATFGEKNSTLKTAYYPIVPAADLPVGEVVDSAPAVFALIKTRELTDLPFTSKADQTEVRGLVINRIETLGSREQQLLREAYPQADLSNVLIIEEGRKLQEPAAALPLAAIGLAVFLLMGLLAWRAYRNA
jgi:hypothetical protein